MTGLEWYGALLLPDGRAPASAEHLTPAACILADAQRDARQRGDCSSEWLADFTPEARTFRQADMDPSAMRRIGAMP